MIHINKNFNSVERQLLAGLKGQVINDIQGAFCLDGRDAWNTLRINTDSLSIDVNLYREGLPVDDEDDDCLDETGVFSIEESSIEPLAISAVSIDVTTKLVEKAIKNIRVFESEIKYFENGELYYQNNITKAIAFDLNDEWLVLDRKVWFDEAITITFCSEPLKGIKDDSEDWQNYDEYEDCNSGLTMEYKLNHYDV